jgi:hypothetical protein
MAKAKLPKFRSLEEERSFWQSHDAFEVLGEEGWEVIEKGTTKVKSVYLLRVGKHGAWLRVPKSWLQKIGAKEGQKIRAWVKGNRLTVEIR